MKILTITDHHTGGSAGVARLSSDVFKRNSFETFEFWGSEHFDFSIRNYLCNKKASKLVFQELQRIKPNVVMLHNFDNLLSPMILSAICDYKDDHSVKVIMTIHDYHIISASNSLSYYEGNNKKFFNSVPNFIELLSSKLDKKSYLHGLARLAQWYPYYKFMGVHKCIDTFICPSEFMFNKVKSVFSSRDVRLIHNPSHFDYYNGKCISDEVVRITFVGRLTKDKGIFDFLRSLSSNNVSNSKRIQIDVVGQGELQFDIQSLIPILSDKNIELILHGHQTPDVVRRIFENSDYVLLPSLCYENAPLTLIEGAYSGCNIITMNYGGMKEIADKFISSILLDDLKDKSLIYLLENINKNERLDYEYRKEILEQYSPDTYFSKVIDIIN